MFMDELDKLERRELRLQDSREERRLLPIDSCSQLDTGYTGRPDTDMARQQAREKEQRDRKVAAILKGKRPKAERLS